jgi:hypothetical protein
VKLCPAPLINFSASQNIHLIQRWQGIGQIFIGQPEKKNILYIMFSLTTFKEGDGHIFPPLADNHQI